jgi:hypothetical protein
VADGQCADLFHGVLKIQLGPISGGTREDFWGSLRFEKGVLDLTVQDIYLLCDPRVVDDCFAMDRN